MDNKVLLEKIDTPWNFKWYNFAKEIEKQTIKLNEIWLITTLKPPGSWRITLRNVFHFLNSRIEESSWEVYLIQKPRSWLGDGLKTVCKY